MAFTRDELVTEIRSLADAENDTRWTATTVLRHLDVAFDREWARILQADPYYRVQTLTPAVDANGIIAQSALSTGSGDSERRFYRVIGVTAGKRRYSPSSLDENVLTLEADANYEAGARIYWWQGTDLVLWPRPGDTATVLVNHRPTLPSALSSGTATITFPSPYELILAYEAAASMLAKGGAETQASADLKAFAEGIRDDLLADLSRREIQPMMWRYPDSRADWGG